MSATREYYINDAGAQVDVLARSAFLRYREALGEDIGSIPEGLYPGDYLKPVGGELAAEYDVKLTTMKESEWLPIVRVKAIAMMMDVIKDDLAALNVHFDVFFSERSLIEGGRDEVGTTIEGLRKSGEVYEAGCRHPKVDLLRIGKIVSRPFSVQRISAMTSIGHSRNRMAAIPILPPILPTTDRKLIVAS